VLVGVALLAALLATLDALETAAGFELEELDTTGAELAALDTGVDEAADDDDLLETVAADDATDDAAEEATGVGSTLNQLTLKPAVSALMLK
jgi:hypothetical protein